MDSKQKELCRQMEALVVLKKRGTHEKQQIECGAGIKVLDSVLASWL